MSYKLKPKLKMQINLKCIKKIVEGILCLGVFLKCWNSCCSHLEVVGTPSSSLNISDGSCCSHLEVVGTPSSSLNISDGNTVATVTITTKRNRIIF
jgi:hypothetical protein